MKVIITFIINILIVLALTWCWVYNSYTFKTTISGEKFEQMETISADNLSKILVHYFRENKVGYRVYKIPNYVEEFLQHDTELSIVYTKSKKNTVLLFVPKKNDDVGLSIFFEKVSDLYKTHPTINNLVIKDFDYIPENKYPNDKYGYKDLRKVCKNFCVINPQTNRLFTFKKYHQVENEVVDILFQIKDF